MEGNDESVTDTISQNTGKYFIIIVKNCKKKKTLINFTHSLETSSVSHMDGNSTTGTILSGHSVTSSEANSMMTVLEGSLSDRSLQNSPNRDPVKSDCSVESSPQQGSSNMVVPNIDTNIKGRSPGPSSIKEGIAEGSDEADQYHLDPIGSPDSALNQELESLKSPSTVTTVANRTQYLPWSAQNRSTIAVSQTTNSMDLFLYGDGSLRPGEIVMRALFHNFTQLAEKKIEMVMLEPFDKSLSKLLQRGENPSFDQLLSALGSVAEHCLPSLLRALLAWHTRQLSDNEIRKLDNVVKNSAELESQLQRREAAVEFIFCLALLEVLKQLPFHPGHDDLIRRIEQFAFRHFKFREGIQNSPNAHNIHMIADLYAEVIGVLAQSRFQSVRKRFMTELKELRAKEPSPHTTQSIISLLMGMKFFRVKMVPIEEFEASFQFMHECGQYFLEVKDKDIKHALAGLFVEILVPVAAGK